MRRHDLAYLHSAAAYRLLNAGHCPATYEALNKWLRAGRPLVVARQPQLAEVPILLGLTLPPGAEPRRLSISVARAAVRSVVPPLTLAHWLNTATDPIAVPLKHLLQQCEPQGIAVSVYGSLAWEMLSGTIYRHTQSDIDLVCDISLDAQLVPCIEALQQAQQALSCSLDGEIRFANGPAVNWKELSQALRQASMRVVAKENTGVALRTLNELIAHLREHSHVC